MLYCALDLLVLYVRVLVSIDRKLSCVDSRENERIRMHMLEHADNVLSIDSNRVFTTF